MKEFVNRETELGILENAYSSDEAEFIVIYGRRRVGKSRIARKSIENIDDSVYYQASDSTPEVQLKNFKQAAKSSFPGVDRIENDWESILSYLGDQNAVIIIDEFPFLIESDKSVPSRFQRVWDTELQQSKAKLVLIGSSISIMKDKILSGGSPLYGRKTQGLDVSPMNIRDLKHFYEGSPDEKIRAYSVFGGTPHYLQFLDGQKSLRQNIEDLLLFSESNLNDEPEFLLKAELGKPGRYFSILDAIASGNTTQNEIAQATGIENSQIGKYLSELRKVRLVKREVPVTEKPNKTRRSIYIIRDSLFRFWFRFIHGNQDRIELVRKNAYENIVEPELNQHISKSFEELARQALPRKIDANYHRIGRWWYKEHEIDVVGLAEDKVILGECKYRGSKIGVETLENLKAKRGEIRISERYGDEYEYALFSRKGFTSELSQKAENKDNIHLFGPADLIPRKKGGREAFQ